VLSEVGYDDADRPPPRRPTLETSARPSLRGSPMSVPVTLEWCGACGSESTAAVCTTCGLSVRGTDADELRSCVLSYRAATAHGDVATADVVRARHARALARLAAAARDPRPTEPGPSETGDARASASTLRFRDSRTACSFQPIVFFSAMRHLTAVRGW